MSTPMTDQRAVDVIACGLGTKSEWSSEDLEWIADVIASVRPHPGDTEPPRYYIDFAEATGRKVEDFTEVTDGGACRHCGHGIVSLDDGDSWFAPDAGTDDEGGDGIWRETCPDNHEDRIAAHEPEEA
jgi:hypothetical protein